MVFLLHLWARMLLCMSPDLLHFFKAQRILFRHCEVRQYLADLLSLPLILLLYLFIHDFTVAAAGSYDSDVTASD